MITLHNSRTSNSNSNDDNNDNVDQLEQRLAGFKVKGLEGDYIENKVLGMSCFAVLQGKMGWEKMAIKLITYKHSGLPREEVIKEMHSLLLCSGGSNVLKFVGWQEDLDMGTIFLAMQFCEGGSLTGWIQSDASALRSVDEKFMMVKGIIRGIAFIHFRGLIHNDIKPDNILLSKGQPVIADFGCTTRPGQTFRGTPGYICPESTVASEASDTFAFGVTVYQIYSRNLRRQVINSDGNNNYSYNVFDLSSNVISNITVRQILEEVLVPLSKRITLREILEVYPSTTSPEQKAQESTKLARFPYIQAFWIKHISNNDASIPVEDFIADTVLGVSRKVQELLQPPSSSLLSSSSLPSLSSDSDASRFRSLIADRDNKMTVSPRSFGLLLTKYPGTEQDTMEEALVKIFAGLAAEHEGRQEQRSSSETTTATATMTREQISHESSLSYVFASFPVEPGSSNLKENGALLSGASSSNAGGGGGGKLTETNAALEQLLESIEEQLENVQKNVQKKQDLMDGVDNWKGLDTKTFGDLLLTDKFTMMAGDQENEYHLFLFETVLVCLKDLQKPKRKPQRLASRASAAAADATSTATIATYSLRGNIFMNAIVKVEDNSDPVVSYNAVKVFWEDQDAFGKQIQVFDLKCKDAEQAGLWRNRIDQQRVNVVSRESNGGGGGDSQVSSNGVRRRPERRNAILQPR